MIKKTNTPASPRQNFRMNLEGTELVIRVEMENVATEPSTSGKSDLIATTSGNQPIPSYPGCSIGLNVYRKKAK